MLSALKDSFFAFPDMWFLLLYSFFSSLKLSKKTLAIGTLLGMLFFYGMFGYLILLFSLGLDAWTKIVTDALISFKLFVFLRFIFLYVGYYFTKRYLNTNPEFSGKALKKSTVRLFAEFICICGSIASFLILISFLILYRVVL